MFRPDAHFLLQKPCDRFKKAVVEQNEREITWMFNNTVSFPLSPTGFSSKCSCANCAEKGWAMKNMTKPSVSG